MRTSNYRNLIIRFCLFASANVAAVTGYSDVDFVIGRGAWPPANMKWTREAGPLRPVVSWKSPSITLLQLLWACGQRVFLFLAILFLPLMIAPTAAFGVTYFVNPGDNISAKLGVLKPGDTLIFNDGTYYQLYINAANGTALKGTATAPIALKAANDGKAVFDSGGTAEPIFITGSSYLTLQGFVARNSSASVVHVYGGGRGGQNNDHITLRRITAYNAGADNNHVFNIEYPQTNILVEDCAAWGRGRYKFIAYHSSYVTFRRDWAFWEGITTFGPAPRAPFAVYGASNVSLENVIGTNAIPTQVDDNYYTSLWHTTDDAINFPANNMTILGSIFYNNCEGHWENESAGAGTYMKDNYFSIPVNPACPQFTTRPYGDGLTWNHNTNTGTITNAVFVNNNVGLNQFGAVGSLLLSNSVMLSNTTAVVSSATHSNVDFLGNGDNGIALKSSDQTINPGYDSDTFGTGAYFFVPARSPLKGAGSGGSDIGANIIHQYVNGTLTQTPLWPWPMEGRILAEKGISVTYASNGGFWNTLNGVYSTPAHK